MGQSLTEHTKQRGAGWCGSITHGTHRTGRDAAAAAGQAKAAANAAATPQGEGSGIPDQAANGKASDTPHQASNDD